MPPQPRSREQRLASLSSQLARLLRQSENPRAEMSEIETLMFRAGLLQWASGPKVSPEQFASAVLEDNPMMFEAIGDVPTEFRPESAQSARELVNLILPARDSLA